MLKGGSLEEIRNGFKWNIPEFYNIGVDVCDRLAATCPDRVAIIHDHGDYQQTFTYQQLKTRSNQLTNLLADLGMNPGDRVGVLLPQNPFTAISHIAVYKIGGIAVPLFTLFGRDALQYRLHDSAARIVITNAQGAEKLSGIIHQLPALAHILCIQSDQSGTIDLTRVMDNYSDVCQPLMTRADDPALIIYTSGTTGNPKGALHAHRTLPGHLPGVEISHDLFPRHGDKIWTPADWAWIGGLMDVLMPALHHGIPVVSRRFAKFTGEAAFDLINRHGIRNAFLPPTALKMMRAVSKEKSRMDNPMRTIASGGETLGAELLVWGRETFGLTINEFYGQTECNMIVSCCGRLVQPTPGVMGFAVPGHDVQIISDAGEIVRTGETGNIAVRAPDPVMFLGYWNNPHKTNEKFSGDWMLTGDKGVMQENGAIKFVARDDDVITSSGYRIGPGEIEDCLLGHAAVEMAAVVGKPDAMRTEIVKAFIKLSRGYAPSEQLIAQIQQHIKTRLSAHEYPREIEFVDSLPQTTTGKIMRRLLRNRA